MLISKLMAPFRHPLEFLFYLSAFDETMKGKLFCGKLGKCFEESDSAEIAFTNYKSLEANPLIQFYLYKRHRGMTKWLHYLEKYLQCFQDLKQRESIRILEIGVFAGGSLQMWESFFAGMKLDLVGVDIDSECLSFASEKCSIEIGDAGDRNFWRDFRARHEHFDLIIDDGDHVCEQQIVALEMLFNHLTPGGYYIIEDLGSKHNRFMAYLVGMASVFNTMSYSDQGTVLSSPIQQHIESIQLIPGCWLLKKREKGQIPRSFECPWVGCSWTQNAITLYEHNNCGQRPPTACPATED